MLTNVPELFMLDVTAPDTVEVEVQKRGETFVLYVNVNGITLMRVCQIKIESLTVNLPQDGIIEELVEGPRTRMFDNA